MTVETVDAHTGEIVETCTAAEARSLTDRIRGHLSGAHGLLGEAYSRRAWVALGYESWDAYCAGEFTEARMVRLDREQRREIVADLRSQGMSTRAIASGLGVNRKTVMEDARQVVQNGPPAPTPCPTPSPVIGTDGKTYTQPNRPAVTAPTAKRRPLVDSFTDATFDLTRAIERIERLATDDRFPQNAEQVATRNRGDLLRAAEALARVLSQLPN